MKKKKKHSVYKVMTAGMLLLMCTGVYGLFTASSKAKKAMDEIQAMLEEQQRQAEEIAEQKKQEQQEQIQQAIENLGTLPVSAASFEDTSEMNVTIIGDSVTLAALDALYEKFPQGYVDAVFGRTIYEGQNALDQLEEENNLGSIMVFSLGTNCDTYKEDYEYLLEHSGRRPVIFVSTYGVGNDSNEIMQSVCAEYRNAYYADWETEALQHKGEWILEDGLHPNAEGSAYYAQKIYQTADKIRIAAREARKHLVP